MVGRCEIYSKIFFSRTWLTVVVSNGRVTFINAESVRNIHAFTNAKAHKSHKQLR